MFSGQLRHVFLDVIVLILFVQISCFSHQLNNGVVQSNRLETDHRHRAYTGVNICSSDSNGTPEEEIVLELPDGDLEVPYCKSTYSQHISSSMTLTTRSNELTAISTPSQLTTLLSTHFQTTMTGTIGESSSQSHKATLTTTMSGTLIIASEKGTSTSMSKLTGSEKFTSVPDKSLISLTKSQVQTVSPVNTTRPTSVHTSLETKGNPSSQPFQSISINTSSTISVIRTSLFSASPTINTTATTIVAKNIFQPIATDAPPPQISTRSDHPVPRQGIEPQTQRLETNKFYSNFYLGNQTQATWTHPYSIAWAGGSGLARSWGLAVSHIERNQIVSGTRTSVDAGEWAYFTNPLGLQSVILSATELQDGTHLTTSSLDAFSINVNLLGENDSNPTITFPLCQGMAFLTGVYHGATPLLQSSVGIQNLTYAGTLLGGTVFKYRLLLSDGYTWLVYVVPYSQEYRGNSFTLLSPSAVQGLSDFTGLIQTAKIPAASSAAEDEYDKSAGLYATAVEISGSVDGTNGTYSLAWSTTGINSQSLLMFALPHHVQSFAASTYGALTEVQLVTTSKGLSTAVRGNSWTLIEPELPISMSFAPWSPEPGGISNLSATTINAMNTAGAVELAENILQQANTGSLYYDGKTLQKFAAVVYAIHDLADNATLASIGLSELEKAFSVHVNNAMTYPLVYDDAWGGVVSISSYLNGNANDDFGNTYYNDHHFHYGYFVYAAAVIGYLNPQWLDEGSNKAWVNMLVRDYANSIPDDPYFPFSRMFDWYHGHSWAAGLFASADGKNEESSSEDAMSAYAIKMWGKIIGDENMEARGNLMLAITARSLQSYFLYVDDNSVEPANFIGNKVSGILFDNKIDHTTYFGREIEYIQGIHMLPILPFSTLTRTREFVQQEASTYNLANYLSTIPNGWRGVIMANLAIVDPVTSYQFFSNATGQFDYRFLDGGASLTWYLAWSAALGGDKGYVSRRQEVPGVSDKGIVGIRGRAQYERIYSTVPTGVDQDSSTGSTIKRVRRMNRRKGETNLLWWSRGVDLLWKLWDT